MSAPDAVVVVVCIIALALAVRAIRDDYAALRPDHPDAAPLFGADRWRRARRVRVRLVDQAGVRRYGPHGARVAR